MPPSDGQALALARVGEDCTEFVRQVTRTIGIKGYVRALILHDGCRARALRDNARRTHREGFKQRSGYAFARIGLPPGRYDKGRSCRHPSVRLFTANLA